MRNGAFFFVAAIAVILVAFWADGAQAGATQTGTLTGTADADAVVLIDASQKTTAAEIPDGSKRVPDAIAPSYPSAYNCALGGGVSVGVKGFGGSFGGHRESEECNVRADSIMATKLGELDMGFQLMCQKYRFYKANVHARAMGNSSTRVCYPNEEFNTELKQELKAQYADEYQRSNETDYDRMMSE